MYLPKRAPGRVDVVLERAPVLCVDRQVRYDLHGRLHPNVMHARIEIVSAVSACVHALTVGTVLSSRYAGAEQ